MGLEDGMHHQSICRDSADDEYGVGLLDFFTYQLLGGIGCISLCTFYQRAVYSQAWSK